MGGDGLSLQELQAEAAVNHAIVKETQRLLQAEGSAFNCAAALAALAVLLPQLQEPGMPKELEDALSHITSLVHGSQDVSVKSGACAVLMGIMQTATDEPWLQIVQDKQLVAELAELAAAVEEDAGVRVNAIGALMAAAQHGELGAQAVVDAGLGRVLEACSSSSPSVDPRVQEAAADLCCQVASHEQCRAGVSQASAVAHMARLLSAAHNNEIRVRVLMALGMLLPSSPDNQRALAQDRQAVRRLLELMRQSDDTDIKLISRDLVAGLAQTHKEELAMALRDEVV